MYEDPHQATIGKPNDQAYIRSIIFQQTGDIEESESYIFYGWTAPMLKAQTST